MGQNYNLNSGFGLNVQSQGAKAAPAQKSNPEGVLAKLGNLFEVKTDSFEKIDTVLSGDVEKETNMYIRQMMLVGMNLKAADKTKHRFDVNI